MSTRIGFFDGEPGVRSMTRLTVFLMTLGVLALIGTIAFVAIKGAMPLPPTAAGLTPAIPPQTTSIIGALAAALGLLCGGIWSALREKRKGDDTATDPPASGGSA